MEPLPKILGRDFELSNAIQGLGQPGHAARLLLEQSPGFPRRTVLGGSPIEYGRRFFSADGGSAYIDNTHFEYNLPEHGDSRQHAPLLHASLRSVRRAKQAAEQQNGCKLHVIANCSDGHQSWGAHWNVLMHRSVFEDLLHRKPYQAGFLATHFVTSIPYTGQGMVGAANGRPACGFQLSQRADWFEQFFGPETMYSRPLLNQRAEHHAAADLARLHIIFFDFVLSPMANFLTAGALQLVLAMIEVGWTDPCLQLEDPLAAVSEISRDLTLRQRFRMVGRGRYQTAVEIQRALAEMAGEFVESGAADQAVPAAREIVAAWRNVVQLLEERDLDQLARRTDCWLKYLLIDRYRTQHSLSWTAAQLKALDLLFGSLDEDGLFFQMAEAGQVDGLPSEAEIERFTDEPPDETRAYLRAHVLRKFGHQVAHVAWDHIRFRIRDGRFWQSEATLQMPDPRLGGRQHSESVLAEANTVDDLLRGLTHDPISSVTLS